ncbi:MAG: archaeosortase/exosortase family protein [Candidatus Thiodiazotropha lotti]
MVWLLSDNAQIQFESQVMLIMILSASAVALFGIKRTARMVLPILVLISAPSVWSVDTQPLQVPMTVFVTECCTLLGMPGFKNPLL